MTNKKIVNDQRKLEVKRQISWAYDFLTRIDDWLFSENQIDVLKDEELLFPVFINQLIKITRELAELDDWLVSYFDEEE